MWRPFIADRVEHDPVGRAVTGDAVAAGADGKLEAGLGGEDDGTGNVGGIGGANDDDGMAIRKRADDLAGFVVLGAIGSDEGARQGRREGIEVEVGGVGLGGWEGGGH
jgi:hypothetical protein